MPTTVFNIRERKTQLDFAEEIAHLLDVDFPDAEVSGIRDGQLGKTNFPAFEPVNPVKGLL